MQLQQSPFLSLISDQQIQQDAGADGTAERCAADRGNRAASLRANRQARPCWKARSPALGANMCWACAPGTAAPADILDEEQIQAARREDVLNALSEIVRKLRTRLGESLATVETAFDAACRGDDDLARSPEGVQHGHEGQRFGRVLPPRYPSSRARRRNRSQFRHGTCESGLCPTADRRVGAVEPRARRGRGSCGIAPASGKGSSSTSTTIAGHGNLEKARSRRSNSGRRHILATCSLTRSWGASHSRVLRQIRGGSRRSARKAIAARSRSFVSIWQSCRNSVSASTASAEAGAPSNKRPRGTSGHPGASGMPVQHRVPRSATSERWIA